MKCQVVNAEAGVAFLCRSGGTLRCDFCDRASVALCDHKAEGARKTCDKRMCGEHRTKVGTNLDHCPDHAAPEPQQQRMF